MGRRKDRFLVFRVMKDQLRLGRTYIAKTFVKGDSLEQKSRDWWNNFPGIAQVK